MFYELVSQEALGNPIHMNTFINYAYLMLCTEANYNFLVFRLSAGVGSVFSS